jgi:hypothetical protein
VKKTMIYTHVLNRGGKGSRAQWTVSEPDGRHCGVRMLGSFVLQPNMPHTKLEGYT